MSLETHFGNDPSVEIVLAQYDDDCRPRAMEFLGVAGGFSGAAFWRLTTDRGLLCLRRWPIPESSDWPDRLRFIHAVLEHVARRGFALVPVPIRTRHAESWVHREQHDWELSAWLPGAADYFPARRPEKLRGALAALALFHLAAADFPRPEQGLAPSPGILRRRRQIDSLRSGGFYAIAMAVQAPPKVPAGVEKSDWIELVRLAHRLLPLYAQAEGRVLSELIAAEPQKVPLQPCIRDIWHDHVLFEGDRVSGLVDFGAMRVDNVACDLARLLGSLSDGAKNAGDWQAGLAAYEAVRPLSADERRLVGVFDRSTALLAGINWLEWIFIEGRTFADFGAVADRLAGIVFRLERLTRVHGAACGDLHAS